MLLRQLVLISIVCQGKLAIAEETVLSKKEDKTVLGFDFGLKHIGIAVGQTVTGTAQPLKSLSAINGEPRWETLQELIDTWQPDALIVGIPLNMDGTIQQITHKAREFAKRLEHRYDLPVHTVDERLTTIEAKEQLFTKHGYKGLSKQNIDGLSAMLIVEDWLKK